MSRVADAPPAGEINLTLRVGARRDDGYHDVRTLLQSIALADTLTFTARRGPFVLDTRASRRARRSHEPRLARGGAAVARARARRAIRATRT